MTQTTGAQTTGDTTRACGRFEVKLAPQTPSDMAAAGSIGRMTIDKVFHGDLEGASKGEMLAVRDEASGSAVYVALERVTGALAGRTGTFVLAHHGTMTRQGQQLTLEVAPHSGTGALAGLSGRMAIIIVDKQHSYEFDYTLPESTSSDTTDATDASAATP